jgi:hypothetical protein
MKPDVAIFVSKRESEPVVIASSSQSLRDLYDGIAVGKIVGVAIKAFWEIGIEVELASFGRDYTNLSPRWGSVA